ncbi:hypothetical protein EJB05_09003, partial [Eragrostis curvula]
MEQLAKVLASGEAERVQMSVSVLERGDFRSSQDGTRDAVASFQSRALCADERSTGSAASNIEMIWNLLMAADRYDVERLKLLCQSIICKSLEVENVSTTLALAYQHNCDKLKNICLHFINSLSVMDAVVKTQGCKNIKTSCPSALVDVYEKTMWFHKTKAAHLK